MEERDSGRRERCYERVGQLKNRQFSASIDHRRLGDNNEDILDYELYKVVRDGNTELDTFVNELEKVCTKNKFHVSIIFNQVSPTGDSLLHVAAEFGKAEVVELIAQHFPVLLNKKNRKGDRPLHVAARAKNIEAMNVILSKCRELIPSGLIELNDIGQFTTSQNNFRNTALHEAVLSKHLEGVNVLLNEHSSDQKASYWTWNSKHRCKSPMYLAAQTGNVEVLERLLQIPFSSVDDISNGDSPLHAAIAKRKPDLLQTTVNLKDKLMYQRDEKGNTPLHHAAHAGYVEGVGIMLDKSKMIAFKRNSEGNLPVHLACKMGHVKVVKKFLELEWFDIGLWLNNEGQNILHMAAMSGQNKMVKYLLGNPKIRSETVNEKDHNGDTPLHLASAKLHLWCLYHLSQDKRINVNLENNKGLTARGIVQMECKIPMTYHESIADSILMSAGVPQKANDLSERLVASRNTERSAKEAVNALMLVAILIATVTFAAGITVPGGFNSSEYSNPKERGKAVLINQRRFKMFIALDTIAMYSSFLGVVILMFVPLSDRSADGMYMAASVSVCSAIVAMLLAFLCALLTILEGYVLTIVDVIGLIAYLFIMSAYITGLCLQMETIFWTRRLIIFLFYGWDDDLIGDPVGGKVNQGDQGDVGNQISETHEPHIL